MLNSEYRGLQNVVFFLQREKQLIANTLRADFERAFSNFNNVQTVSVYDVVMM